MCFSVFPLGNSKFATLIHCPPKPCVLESIPQIIYYIKKKKIQLSIISLHLASSKELLVHVAEKKNVYFTVLTSTAAVKSCRRKMLKPRCLSRPVCYTELFRATLDIWLEKLRVDTQASNHQNHTNNLMYLLIIQKSPPNYSNINNWST